MTPIHMAAEEGCADSMRAMMYHTRNRRSSVEYLAQRHGHFDIAEMLEQRWDEEARGVAEEGQMQPPPIPTPGSPGVPMAYAHPVHTDDGSSQARPDAGGRVAPSRGRTRPRGGGGLLSCCGGKPKRRESAGVGVPAVRACAIHPPPSPAILTVIASECGLSSAGAQRRRCAQEGTSSYAGVQYHTADFNQGGAAGAGPAPPAEEAVAEPALPPGCDPC